LEFLILTASRVFSFAAMLDPFLNMWDERFHALMVILIVLIRFDIGVFGERHTISNSSLDYTRNLLHNNEVFTSLKLPDNSVLFNVRYRFYIEAMFYTGLPAYNFIPTFEQYHDLKLKGMRVAIFKPGHLNLPSYLVSNPSVIIISKEIKGKD
jgi:4-amino-4-deoxy-L-arabinose transferase